MKCLFTPEELANTKVRQIDEILDKEFTLDYFKWQQDNNIEIDEPFRADGLNRILYKCPHCLKEGMTEGKGINLICHGCGASMNSILWEGLRALMSRLSLLIFLIGSDGKENRSKKRSLTGHTLLMFLAI